MDFEENEKKEKNYELAIADVRRVSKTDVENFESRYQRDKLFKSLNKFVQDKHKIFLKNREVNENFEFLRNYVKRSCLKENCQYKSSCSPACSHCILQSNGISYCINDDTIIYYINTNCNMKEGRFLITEKDLYGILRYYPSANDTDLFLPLNSMLDIMKLKSYLIDNPIYRWINQYFNFVTTEEKREILSVVLFKEKMAINPIVLRDTFPTITDFKEIRQKLKKAANDNAALKECLDYRNPSIQIEGGEEIKFPICEEYSDQQLQILKRRLFNYSIEELLKYSFPAYNNETISLLKTEIQFAIPDFLRIYILKCDENNFEEQKTKLLRILLHKPYSLFQFYPPTSDELIAIFYFHRKLLSVNSGIVDIQNLIFYDNPIKIIHYCLAKQLIRKYHVVSIITKGSSESDRFRAYENTYNEIIKEEFHININEENKIFQTIEILRASYSGEIENISKKNFKPFHNLERILFAISNGNTKTIDQLSLLLLKVYLSRSYLSYLDKTNTNLTLCLSNNTNYIKSLLMDVFCFRFLFSDNQYLALPSEKYLHLFFREKGIHSFYHVSNYSSSELSNENHIGELIKDKLCGNIVNIDMTQTLSGNSVIKNLVSGRKRSVVDPVFGKVSYRSNIQYIHIFDNKKLLANNALSDIPHSTIHFEGDLSSAIYEPLAPYELFFLVTGFLRYALDLLSDSNDDSIDVIHSSSPLPSLGVLIDGFISEFCEDKTVGISREQINQIPLSKITGSKNEKERKIQAEKLGIDKLDFSFSKDLYESFCKWIQVSYPSLDIFKEKDFTNKLLEKYHILFYNKKYDTGLNGEKREARGFYGITLNIELLDRFLYTTQQKKEAVSQQMLQSKFTEYFNEIISKYSKFNI